MAKCPKCDVEIDYLHYYEERGFTIEIDAEGKPIYEEKTERGCGKYECPECAEELFDNEEDAIKFLKGSI